MRIWAIPRVEMERVIRMGFPPTCAAISITVPGESKVVFPEGVQVLALEFYDMDTPVPGEEEKYPIFTEDQGRQVIEFLRSIGDKDLLIHCHAGIARSGAIALVAHELFGTDAAQFEADNKSIDPQPIVVRILRTLAGLPDRPLPVKPVPDPRDIF